MQPDRKLLSGNEALATAALHAGITMGSGYPGTPSSEILEEFNKGGGFARWSPNEKVALEVGIGVAFAGGRALVTMKHVGVNVAADPYFSVAYTGVDGALVIVSADDPGMSSSQNEQDNRRFALAAGMPTIEPSNSQETYDFFLEAVRLSEEWHSPVMFRMTTRVCHSKSLVKFADESFAPPKPGFTRNIPGRVMIPAHARPAHRRMRDRLAKLQAWNETSALNTVHEGDAALGIITSGISYVHVREAAPDARVLKLGMTYPLPFERIRQFAQSVKRCVVIEEGDPYLVEQLRMNGIAVEDKPEAFRFGELNVNRVRRILANDTSPETVIKGGKPPELCAGCPHRMTFLTLNRLNCIVSGDIGCYTLGALPPFEAMDSQLCMGASIGIGLGLRHTLPQNEARRVVSVIGDSTFFHSGLTGIAEMVYNPPKNGHIVLILDNGTTAMTGMQEHPGTGRSLDHMAAQQILPEDVVRAMGVANVKTVGYGRELEDALSEAMAQDAVTVIVMRQPCRLMKVKTPAPKCEGENDDE
ncbi:MAG: thiamine pyrophosphate-binding protein [Candidatus Hydrogenedentes bacterium]|nr:thiamine pyrophosphate-binding protein [Candidatus Hydrogenedentota bacterium]